MLNQVGWLKMASWSPKVAPFWFCRKCRVDAKTLKKRHADGKPTCPELQKGKAERLKPKMWDKLETTGNEKAIVDFFAMPAEELKQRRKALAEYRKARQAARPGGRGSSS